MVQPLWGTKKGKLKVPSKKERTKCLRYNIATEDLPLSGRDFQRGKLA